MILLGVALVLAAAPSYDPLKVGAVDAQVWDGTVTDSARSRDIPVRVYLPEAKGAQSVILFSHGLGGSRENDPYLGQHWAKRGYVAVFMQHAGSDDRVWKDEDPSQRMGALKDAASLQNFMLRVKDVPAVLDALAQWNSSSGHALKGRLDLRHIGMAGHSFGAVTSQAVSGENFPLAREGLTDARIKAAVMMSPSTPKRGDAKTAFGSVKIPWLLMTGTNDDSPIGGQGAASRREVFPALPPGSKYELVLDKAEHSAFSDRALPGDQQPRNPNHHRAVLALSTAFFDAYLRNDSAARAWLDGGGPRSVLEPADQWQVK
jgi:predicted dienelactone hydrolase